MNIVNLKRETEVSSRFDAALLVKSFNRISVDEKKKLLEKILKTLKVDGQVFVYEDEWSKDSGLNI